MLSVPLSDKLVPSFGFLQPAEGEERTCAVALVPLLALDNDGFRLGYGGGFYDRYLLAHPEVLRVGLLYEGQRLPALPREEGDIPLHYAITEQGLLRFSQTMKPT